MIKIDVPIVDVAVVKEEQRTPEPPDPLRCGECGGEMVRMDNCYTCTSCGSGACSV